MTAQALSWVTHQHRGDSGDHRVQHGRRDGARVLGSEIGFRVRGLVAEEALHVHVERVRVLEVICQHDRPRHDHQLEIKHGRQRVGQEHLPTIQWRTSKHLSSRYSSRISPASEAPSARGVGTRRCTRSHGTALEPEWESAREESAIKCHRALLTTASWWWKDTSGAVPAPHHHHHHHHPLRGFKERRYAVSHQMSPLLYQPWLTATKLAISVKYTNSQTIQWKKKSSDDLKFIKTLTSHKRTH